MHVLRQFVRNARRLMRLGFLSATPKVVAALRFDPVGQIESVLRRQSLGQQVRQLHTTKQSRRRCSHALGHRIDQRSVFPPLGLLHLVITTSPPAVTLQRLSYAVGRECSNLTEVG